MPLCLFRSLICCLTCLGRQAQSYCDFPGFPLQLFFLMVFRVHFRYPKPSLAGEHILFVCAADESEENDNEQTGLFFME